MGEEGSPLMGLKPRREPAGESAHLCVWIKAWLLSSVAGELPLAGDAHRLLNGLSGAGRCEGPGKYTSSFSGVMQSRPRRARESETSFTCTSEGVMTSVFPVESGRGGREGGRVTTYN